MPRPEDTPVPDRASVEDGPPAAGGPPVRVSLRLRSFATDLLLPPSTDVLCTEEPEPLADVYSAVREALASPLGTVPLAELCREALARRKGAGAAPTAVVVISDNTRAVPYKSEGGILWPLVEALLAAGFAPGSITLLVATGTHRVMADEEIWALVDERVRAAGVQIRCHDASDPVGLASVGSTVAGDEVFLDKTYLEADLRILTGLIEVHLMAGVSGGRKSICPGLVDVRSVRGFHGAVTLCHPNAAGLVLDGNPCHDTALEVACMVRPDFILNVTARQDGRVAGIFAGDMEQAHQAGVAHLRSFIQILLERPYDVVVTHGGSVGINHYQAEKAVDVAVKAVRDGGYVVVVADTTEPEPVGSGSYRRLLKLLGELGPEAFIAKLQSKEWEFVHNQWGVQTWAQVMQRVPAGHIFFFSPQIPPHEYAALPGVNPELLLAAARGAEPADLVRHFVTAAVSRACAESRAATGRVPTVAYLADGPHGIPVLPAS
jgi:nickel-dependent lactate racemase